MYLEKNRRKKKESGGGVRKGKKRGENERHGQRGCLWKCLCTITPCSRPAVAIVFSALLWSNFNRVYVEEKKRRWRAHAYIHRWTQALKYKAHMYPWKLLSSFSLFLSPFPASVLYFRRHLTSSPFLIFMPMFFSYLPFFFIYSFFSVMARMKYPYRPQTAVLWTSLPKDPCST